MSGTSDLSWEHNGNVMSALLNNDLKKVYCRNIHF